MVDRVTKVRLVAEVSNYVQNMERARKSTSEMADGSAEKLAAQKQAMEDLGKASLALGAVAAAGIAIAVSKFADFDAAISNVKAATQESAANMGLLREAALEAGADSVFTATEAANAIEELGKAGLSTADVLGGALTGSLDLASAGELGIARAAEIASITLSQFNLAGSETGHVADVLAAGAGKALGSVDDLANGLKFVGPVASAMGVSLEETTGVLALFAQQGIIGEQAGTSLRGMLSSLTSPSKIAAKEIEKLGITLYDQQGSFLGVENAAGQLQSAYSGMTDQQRDFSLGVLFGNEQITSARVLYAAGAEGVREWRDAVDESGYASQVAADRLDNLQGDVEKLGGAFDTALIRTGSSANDALRTLTQSATFLVDGIGALPEPVLGAGMAVGVVTAAVALAGGGALIAIPKVMAFKASLDLMGVSGRTAAVRIVATGGAIAAASLAAGYFISRQADIAATSDALTDSLDQTTGAFTDYTRELVAKKLAETGAFEAAKEAGITQKELTDAVLAGGDALDEVKAKLTDNNNIGTFFTGVGVRAGQASSSIRDLRTAMDDSESSFKNQAAAAGGSASKSQDASEAYLEAAGSADRLTSDLTTLIETINAANGVGQDAVSSNASYRAAIDEVAESVREFNEEHGVSVENINESTAAGSANADMFADLASKSQAAALAQFELDGNVENYKATLESGRQAMYDQILALTGSADAAQALTDKIYAMPTQKEIDILVDTQAAELAISNWMFRERRISVKVDAVTGENSYDFGGFGAIGRASGGILPGAPSSKDNMLIHAASGEFVVNAAATQRNRGLLEQINSGGVPAYATGGVVQYAQAPVQYAGSGGGFSLDDVSITGTLEIGLDGVSRLVDGKLHQYDKANSRIAEQQSTGWGR